MKKELKLGFLFGYPLVLKDIPKDTTRLVELCRNYIRENEIDVLREIIRQCKDRPFKLK